MKLVTQEQLEELFQEHEKGAAWSGATTLSLIYKVPDHDSKTVGGEKALTKTVAVPAAMSGAEYEKKVNKIREKEGVQEEEAFKAEPPKGFQRVSKENRMLMESIKKGERAIMCYIDPANKDKVQVLKYEDQEGREVPKDQIADYLTPSGYRNKFEGRPASKAQEDVPPEKRFRIVRPYVKNIKALKVGGELYLVKTEKGAVEMDGTVAERVLEG